MLALTVYRHSYRVLIEEKEEIEINCRAKYQEFTQTLWAGSPKKKQLPADKLSLQNAEAETHSVSRNIGCTGNPV